MFSVKESGQGLVEYALIIALVAIVIIIAVTAFGESLLDYYQYIIDSWPG
jgi:pilus assembly protein Flp/PilA